MLEKALVYGTYAVAGIMALAVYSALPREGRPIRRGLSLTLGALGLGALVLLLGSWLNNPASERIYFYVLSLLAILGGLRTITHSRPVYSALYFLLVVLSTAGLAVLAGAEFLAAALVIVYAGAILVTYVFVIMMAQQSSPKPGEGFDYDRHAREPGAAVLAGFVLVATIAGIIVTRPGSRDAGLEGSVSFKILGPTEWHIAATTFQDDRAGPSSQHNTTEGNTLRVARVLLSENGFPVSLQIGGVLLTVAMIGAVAVARKRLPRPAEEGDRPPPGEIGKQVKPF